MQRLKHNFAGDTIDPNSLFVRRLHIAHVHGQLGSPPRTRWDPTCQEPTIGAPGLVSSSLPAARTAVLGSPGHDKRADHGEEGGEGGKLDYTSRFASVILAQGPCKSSLYRSNFNGWSPTTNSRSSGLFEVASLDFTGIKT